MYEETDFYFCGKVGIEFVKRGICPAFPFSAFKKHFALSCCAASSRLTGRAQGLRTGLVPLSHPSAVIRRIFPLGRATWHALP
ncbi:MAG: hypothetical protein H6883_05805 [Rhodobiaceae bacterium]|nr:hypothetical protein [Rhodobiaceae bacterium]MCC0055632.1 hypothetical protein [Rhodobiaceae bacterium]